MNTIPISLEVLEYLLRLLPLIAGQTRDPVIRQGCRNSIYQLQLSIAVWESKSSDPPRSF